MKIIQTLSELIDEEIHDGKKYIKLALEHKDKDKALAEMFYNLSLEEMRHMNILHTAVVKQIDIIRAEKADNPMLPGMEILYDTLHQIAINKAKEVQILQGMYRE